MRILLVGTDLAPVHADAGALELLVSGWAGALARDHEVWVASVPAGPDAPAPAPGVEVVAFVGPADLEAVVRRLAPDVVVANNRPGWQAHLPAPTLHLLHNWPDAWALGPGGVPDVGGAGLAAVSGALAATVDAAFGAAGRTRVVDPWVDPALLALAPDPEAGTVWFPNRLLAKKGVAELCAAAGRPALDGCRVLIPDHLSPWTAPTAEHRALRALVASSARCELVAPARDRAAVAARYARSAVAVCPSVRPEGLGLSALEAQAAAVPVVSSGLGGLAEATLLPHLVADPSDPDRLAAAIAAGLEVPAGRRLALRDEVARRWSPAASLRSLLDATGAARPAGR